MRPDQYRNYELSLREHSLFSPVDRRALRDLLTRLHPGVYQKNMELLNPAKASTRFHILINGRIKVYTYDLQRDRELTLFILKGGDCFDIFSLFGQSKHQLYYKTLEECEVLSCPIEQFHTWLPQTKEFNRNLTAYILKKMARLQEAVIDMVLADTATRLLKLLWRHVNMASKEIEDINDLSDRELASLIGTTRAVMNRHLQVFKEEGILRTGRNRIQIANWDLLEKKVHNTLQIYPYHA